MALRVLASGYWRRKFGTAAVLTMFVFLGYQSVMLTRTSYVTPYKMQDTMPLQVKEEHPVERREASKVEKDGASQEDMREPPAAPMVVLVVSSMPRGGSTLLTDLLSNIQDSVVLFEPLWLIEKTDCYNDPSCTNKYLREVLTCNFTSSFEEWLKHKGLFFRYFSPEARRCLGTKPDEAKAACLKAMNLKERCKAAPVVVVKVIRARLSWMMKFLEDPHLNLKVIHLTRDPRGSIRSIASFGWQADPRLRCSDLHDDMEMYDKLREVFPSTVAQVRYEQLCLRPDEVTRDMFRFLFGKPTIPDPVKAFLDLHMRNVTKSGSMSTFKNSSKEFESWRYKISEKMLQSIEHEPVCVQAIKAMNHAVFGSIKAAKDSKIPLILNT